MKKTVRDIDVKGKKLIVRCDFNVPMKDGRISDDTRITAALPTIEYLIGHGAAVILMSHMGRPKGEAKPEFTLAPVAERLSEYLKQEVVFIPSPVVVDEEVRNAAAALKEGQVMLLENLRFRKEEEKNDASFAKELAELAEIFVQDAFGTAHRAHASTAGIAAYLPAVSGFLIEHIGYKALFPYSAVFVAAAFATMFMVKHGDNKIEAKKGLEAFDVED